MKKLIVAVMVCASSVAFAATAMLTMKPLIGSSNLVSTKNMQWDDTKPTVSEIKLTGR